MKRLSADEINRAIDAQLTKIPEDALMTLWQRFVDLQEDIDLEFGRWFAKGGDDHYDRLRGFTISEVLKAIRGGFKEV